MQLRSLVLFSAAVVSALVSSASAFTAATTKPAYYCETDDECDAKFPGTVCISVDNYGVVTSKCTPNTDSRPACRGAQPGLCPSYQSEEISYLNVHCVFVEVDASGKDVVDLTTSKTSTTSSSGSGSGSGKSKTSTGTRGRYLLLAATNKTTTAPAKGSTDGSKTAEVVVSSSSGSKSTAPVISTGKYAKVTIGKQSITGEFKCVDVSDCANQAYDPTTCDVEACGSPNSKMQCNNHGTCTYKSVQKMSKRSCMCYAGYGGDKCQQEVSNECDVDCGTGGDCVDGVCKCKKGFDGKAYKGKQGKANQRCTKCTNDLACQNDNACDISTGVCVCGPGFNGPTCGATEDSCTKRDCGTLGSCRVFNNGSSACYCNQCAPDCNLCPTKDCSTCPSLASTIFTSKAVLFVSAIVTLLLGNLAL